MVKKNNSAHAGEGSKAGIVTGVLVGAALGAVAALLLAPKSGKKLRNDVKKRSADFYRYVAPKVKTMKAVGEQEFKVFMGQAAKQYAVAKKLTAAEQKALIGDAKRSWEHVKKHLGKRAGRQ